MTQTFYHSLKQNSLFFKLALKQVHLCVIEYLFFRWHGASDDAFPTLGGGVSGSAAPVVTPTPVWGPKR